MNENSLILIVDDDKFFLQVISDLVKKLGYRNLTAENGIEAIEKALTYAPDVIICDIVMPWMDGFGVVRRLKDNPVTTHIPVMMVTSLDDKVAKVKGLVCGADEFLSKPVDETELAIRIKNLLKVKKFEDYLLEHEKILEGEVKDKTLELKKAYVETIYRLTLASEFRDKETGDHIRRISLYSQTLASALKLPENEVEEIFFASPMHDVGKICIPDNILLKPGAHTPEEFEIMKKHTTMGAKILHGSSSNILKRAEEIALTHHEKWEGGGYPTGLKGEEIPISGRIVKTVDVYDALRSSRPYRPVGYSHEEAIEMMTTGMKDHFDPFILDKFLEHQETFNNLFEENRHAISFEYELINLASE